MMIISKTALIDAVTHAMIGVSSRPAIPILAGVRLTPDGSGGLAFTGFDYETSATCTVCVDGDPINALLHGPTLKQVAQSLPGPDIEITEESENRYSLASGSASATLQGMPVEDYPETPQHTGGGTVEGQVFAEAVTTVVPSVSRDDTVATLAGVQLVAQNGGLTARATDRYRLAENWWPADENLAFDIIVTAKTLTAITRTLDTATDWEVGVTDRLLTVRAGTKSVTTALVDGDYPNIAQLFPDSVPSDFTLAKGDIEAPLSLAAALAERNTPVIIDHDGDGHVTITSTGDGAETTAQIQATDHHGEAARFGINPDYLRDAIKAVDHTHVTIGTTQPGKPVTIYNGTHRQLIMPVRTNN